MQKKLEDLMVINFPLIEAAKNSFLASVRACYAIENNAPHVQEALAGSKNDHSKRPVQKI